MNAIEVPGQRAIVGSNNGLALIDLLGLPPGGSSLTIDHLFGYNARDIYAGPSSLYYVNLNRSEPDTSAGFAVVELAGNHLQLIGTVSAPGVIYEKMCVAGDYLYVTAHRYGLRIFSLADPFEPAPVGSLLVGFVDAFAVTVVGDSAFVADGGGGLKIVDVSDRTSPTIVAGETLSSAVGTAEDLVSGNGNVYVALGGAGLGVYPGGDVDLREVVAFDGFAESLCWVDGYLAVSNTGGVLLFDVGGPTPTLIGSEIVARRGAVGESLRLCSGLSEATGGRLLCSNWDFLDVYQIKDVSQGNQADITPSRQRIRFSPDGGSQEVTIQNDGALPLTISSVQVQPSSFSVDYAGGVLNFGESVTFNVSYDGTEDEGTGYVHLVSNDPDESPLPIQVFGATEFLDPGEPATPFTLTRLTYDPETDEFLETSFNLADHWGKVIWFQVFATW